MNCKFGLIVLFGPLVLSNGWKYLVFRFLFYSVVRFWSNDPIPIVTKCAHLKEWPFKPPNQLSPYPITPTTYYLICHLMIHATLIYRCSFFWHHSCIRHLQYFLSLDFFHVYITIWNLYQCSLMTINHFN